MRFSGNASNYRGLWDFSDHFLQPQSHIISPGYRVRWSWSSAELQECAAATPRMKSSQKNKKKQNQNQHFQRGSAGSTGGDGIPALAKRGAEPWERVEGA